MNDQQKELLAKNRLVITDEVTWDTFTYIREALTAKSLAGSPALRIQISSSGGRVTSGLDAYDFLRAYEGQKIGIVRGMAMSIAAILLQACEWRVATPHSRILIHNIGRRDVTFSEVETDELAQKFISHMRASQESLYNVLMRRTRRTREEIVTTCALDEPMSAQEAKEFGLIDQIVETEKDIQSPDQEGK